MVDLGFHRATLVYYNTGVQEEYLVIMFPLYSEPHVWIYAVNVIDELLYGILVKNGERVVYIPVPEVR